MRCHRARARAGSEDLARRSSGRFSPRSGTPASRSQAASRAPTDFVTPTRVTAADSRPERRAAAATSRRTRSTFVRTASAPPPGGGEPAGPVSNRCGVMVCEASPNVDTRGCMPILGALCRPPQICSFVRAPIRWRPNMRNRRLAGVLASVIVATQLLSGQSASSRTEELSRAMARVGTERVFAAYAVDYGANLYGAWVSGYDLFIEQFGRSGRFEIVCLDLRTGERKWVAQTGPNRLKAAPNPGDRYVVFLTENDGGMIVVNRATGVHEYRLRAELN